jgi:Asp-tRNA(Asn)/Glu-tRNA(Gln) amidotransferase A subunit family amidase
MSIQHALTHTVRDSAALLDATHGPASGDPYCAPRPERSFGAEVGVDPGVLRVGLITTPPSGADVHPECVKAAETAARLCETLGHVVEPISWPISGNVFAAIGPIMQSNMAASVAERLEALERDLRVDDLEPGVREAVDSGRVVTGEQYARALRTCHAVGRAMATLHDTHDIVLTPTLGLPPLLLGSLDSSKDRAAYLELVGRFAGFTAVFNMTGQPAMSVPLYWTADRLPVGVQFAARFGGEAVLFRLASQLEHAAPWRRQPPRI